MHHPLVVLLIRKKFFELELQLFIFIISRKKLQGDTELKKKLNLNKTYYIGWKMSLHAIKPPD